MKSLKQFREGFQFMTSPEQKLWQGDNAYALSRGFKIYMGGCGFPDAKMDLSLYFPTGDEQYIKDSMDKPLKSGEYLFRYTNIRLKAGDMVPLVKINIKRGLIYFNKPEASDADILDFQTKGVKLRFVNLRDDYASFLKHWMYKE